MYDALGGLCTEFGFYGGEHIDYSLRAQKTGMVNKERPFAGPINCSRYIWNYDTHADYQKPLTPIKLRHHEESISRAQKDSFLLASEKHEQLISNDRPIRYPIQIKHEIKKIT
jgi:hypothetical protein